MRRNLGIAIGVLAMMTTLSSCGPTGEVATSDLETSSAAVNPEIWPEITSPVGLDPKIEDRISELLDTMTIEDKVGQVVQGEIRNLTPEDVRKYRLGSVLNGGGVQPYGKRYATVDDWLELADAFWEASMDTSGGDLAVPIIWGTDAVHGHTNVQGAIAFPQNIGLGATHNPELLHEIGRITAVEMAISGLDWNFSPTVAVARDDRWGRTYESWAEHPDVARDYAREMILGIQGEAGTDAFLDDNHIVACSKHFLADGGTLGGIDRGDNPDTEADLLAIHGAGYTSALEVGVQTVMASFSSWQGTRMHSHRGLLTDVLKGRMGFDGFVVGDWNAHADVPGCSATSCPTAFMAGVDMFMAPEEWRGMVENTIAQVHDGTIPIERLDDAVRRILRVKFRAGLFDKPKPSQRPLAGRTDLLGSAEHRAVARQAVRESLVLLKNNSGLLPLDRKQQILVAGDGAHNIGKQSGGWTLTWQGTDTTNEDFPNGTSIWEGIRSAVEAAGGTAILAEGGAYQEQPDVAIVVFGEEPYAEFHGDLDTLDYGHSRPDDLKLLKSLGEAGVPVVSIFLSGRPMWVNPELNASDAFVAAWLPGTEGGGVADILFRTDDGETNHDFKGRLAHSWPRTATQTPLNIGDDDYDPLFAYGFGLTYKDAADLSELAEDSRQTVSDTGRTAYFDGAPVAPWKLYVGDPRNQAVATIGGSATTWDRDNLIVRPVDRDRQEDARAARWAGYERADLYLGAAQSMDLSTTPADRMALVFDILVEEAPSGLIFVGMRCGEDCEGRVDITEILHSVSTGEWQTLRVPLKHIADSGADLAHVTAPWNLSTEGTLALRFANVRLEANEQED